MEEEAGLERISYEPLDIVCSFMLFDRTISKLAIIASACICQYLCVYKGPLLEAINKGLGQTHKSLFKHRAEAPLLRMFTNAAEKTRANRDVDTWPSTPPSLVLSPPPLMGQPGPSFLPSSRRQQSDIPAMTSRPKQATRVWHLRRH